MLLDNFSYVTPHEGICQVQDVRPLTVSVCIPAHNEERIIAYTLKHILNSTLDKDFVLKDVTVVSDSTDNTNEFVKEFARLDQRVRLIESRKRLGLSGAINLFLENAESEIIVIIDADVFLKPDSMNALVRPFSRYVDVYATSGRKVPISSCVIVHAFWIVHHELCLLHPKLCSSIIAFRRGVVKKIPPFFGTPDTYLMSILEKKRLKVLYVPAAEGRTLEPNDLKGFIKQRKRIYIQHLFLKKCLSYDPPAFKPRFYIKSMIRAMLNDRKRRILSYLACALIELLSRLMGLLSFKKEWRESYLWEKVR